VEAKKKPQKGPKKKKELRLGQLQGDEEKEGKETLEPKRSPTLMQRWNQTKRDKKRSGYTAKDVGGRKQKRGAPAKKKQIKTVN